MCRQHIIDGLAAVRYTNHLYKTPRLVSLGRMHIRSTPTGLRILYVQNPNSRVDMIDTYATSELYDEMTVISYHTFTIEYLLYPYTEIMYASALRLGSKIESKSIVHVYMYSADLFLYSTLRVWGGRQHWF